MNPALFPLGKIVTTGGVANKLTYDEVLAGLLRHVTGDWGDIRLKAGHTNDRALVHDERILSSYRTASGVKFWVITMADRSVTTILLPEES